MHAAIPERRPSDAPRERESSRRSSRHRGRSLRERSRDEQQDHRHGARVRSCRCKMRENCDEAPGALKPVQEDNEVDPQPHVEDSPMVPVEDQGTQAPAPSPSKRRDNGINLDDKGGGKCTPKHISSPANNTTQPGSSSQFTSASARNTDGVPCEMNPSDVAGPSKARCASAPPKTENVASTTSPPIASRQNADVPIIPRKASHLKSIKLSDVSHPPSRIDIHNHSPPKADDLTDSRLFQQQMRKNTGQDESAPQNKGKQRATPPEMAQQNVRRLTHLPHATTSTKNERVEERRRETSGIAPLAFTEEMDAIHEGEHADYDIRGRPKKPKGKSSHTV